MVSVISKYSHTVGHNRHIVFSFCTVLSCSPGILNRFVIRWPDILNCILVGYCQYCLYSGQILCNHYIFSSHAHFSRIKEGGGMQTEPKWTNFYNKIRITYKILISPGSILQYLTIAREHRFILPEYDNNEQYLSRIW